MNNELNTLVNLARAINGGSETSFTLEGPEPCGSGDLVKTEPGLLRHRDLYRASIRCGHTVINAEISKDYWTAESPAAWAKVNPPAPPSPAECVTELLRAATDKARDLRCELQTHVDKLSNALNTA